MSVNWSWNAKFGEIDLTQKHHGETKSFVVDVYYANCLFCMIYESPEMKEKQEYQFVGFYSDLEHLKRCIGLSPYNGEYDNSYDFHKYEDGTEYGDKWTEIRIDVANKDKEQLKNLFKIGNTLVQAGFRVVYDKFNYKREQNETTKDTN